MTAPATPNTGEFLFDAELGERIRDIARGANMCCAVAFWSEEGIDRVFETAKAARRARIVCDISMGSTSAEALEALGAPHRKSLRHLRGLHAKVYLSDLGLVTGSANASASALAHGATPAKLTEAGSFHVSGSAAWVTAAAWFKTVHKRAHKVDDDALEWARRAYRPPRTGAYRPPLPGSLLDAVRLDPERFTGAGFVFVDTASGDDEIAAARTSAKRLSSTVAKRTIDAWPRGGFFTGWPAEKVRGWPTLFFEFWQPVQALTVFAKTVGIHDPGNGSILSTNDWRTAKKLFGVDLPTRSAIARADAALAALVRGDGDAVLFTDAHALARRLVELEAAAAGGEARVPRRSPRAATGIQPRRD